MKKLILFLMIAVISTFGVFAATPSCGDTLTAGTYIFDSDLTCNTTYGESTLLIADSNILIDCDGYSIYENQPLEETPIFKTDGQDWIENVTIQNCNFYHDVVFLDDYGANFNNFNWYDNYWEYTGTSGWTTFFDYYGDWYVNSTISGNVVNVTANPPSESGVYFMYVYYADNLVIENNDINIQTNSYRGVFSATGAGDELNFIMRNNNFQSNQGIFCIAYPLVNSQPLIYNNNFSTLAFAVDYSYCDEDLNISQYYDIGNYYGSCTDDDSDGFCDDVYTVSNLGGVYWDGNALSNPAPYVAPEEEPTGGSSTSASHRGDVAYCTDEGCFADQEAALLAISGQPAKTGNPLLDLWNWLTARWQGGGFP